MEPLMNPIEYKQQFLKEDEARLQGAQQQRIRTAFGHVNVTVGGNRSGPAMVLWPSLMMQGSMWSYQYEYFGSKYRMVLIDSPGVGKSDALRKPVYLEDSGEVVVKILDELGIEKCIFGGNSWGAMLAASLPAWYPDRLHASMVINGTASLPDSTETVKMTIASTLLYMNGTMPKWWVNFASSAFAGDTAEATNPAFMRYLNCIFNDDPKSIYFQLQGILLGRVDRHELLRTIKSVPVLVIAGEEDRQFPVHICRKMANAIQGSKFVVLQEAAHLASRERPDLVNPEIEKFLAGVPALSLGRFQTTTPAKGPRRIIMAETLVRQQTAPEWVTQIFHEIDTLNFSSGFKRLDEHTEMQFGVAVIHGVEAIKQFFVKIDSPLEIEHRIHDFWDGGETKILRGDAKLRTRETSDAFITAPLMQIFYMEGEQVRRWFIVNGPIHTDSVL